MRGEDREQEEWKRRERNIRTEKDKWKRRGDKKGQI